MKTILCVCGAIVLLLVVTLAAGCSDDSSTNPKPNPLPTNVPEIPIPSSPTEVLPGRSDHLAVGLSDPLDEFEPMVSEIELMKDDGSTGWIGVNRHLVLACPGVLPEYSCNHALSVRSFISDRPRLLHQRYWKKIKQVTLDPGTSYEQAEVITYGTSTSHTESREFSQTVGVAVEIGGDWKMFSATVEAYYEQTTTKTEVDAVTFSTETTKSETYSVQADPSHTRVYALWQLVDTFSLVDADMVRIHDSPTLLHVKINAITDIEFPNRDVIYQSVTRF